MLTIATNGSIIINVLHRGVEQLAARRAHNPKVVSSSLTPATTKFKNELLLLGRWFCNILQFTTQKVVSKRDKLNKNYLTYFFALNYQITIAQNTKMIYNHSCFLIIIRAYKLIYSLTSKEDKSMNEVISEIQKSIRKITDVIPEVCVREGT